MKASHMAGPQIKREQVHYFWTAKGTAKFHGEEHAKQLKIGANNLL